jgi:uncharacterized membrane protein
MFQSIIATFISFILLDLAWVNFVTVKAYKARLSKFIRGSDGNMQPDLLACALFYIVAIFCFYYLAIRPAENIRQAIVAGCVASFFSYSTYALTGQAIFKNWAWPLTLLDIGWGIFLCGTCAGIGFLVKSNLG